MTLTFSAMILVAIWLIYMGLTQVGVAMPRWATIVAGVIAIIAGILLLIGR